jgi:hypothetical protein
VRAKLQELIPVGTRASVFDMFDAPAPPAPRTGQRQDSGDASGVLNDLPGGGGPPENTLIPTIYDAPDNE